MSGLERPDPSLQDPTATHTVAEMQSTPRNEPAVAPAGMAAVWRTHCWPSHRVSKPTLTPALVLMYPTAVHATAELQEMPLRYDCPESAGTGIGRDVHVDPSQCAARALSSNESAPTATHEATPGHDTP
jgi:hypothetical protein